MLEPAIGIAIAAVLLVAPAAAQTVRTTHGDTTIVRTAGPGLWGAPQTPKEVVCIGDGNSAVTFGAIASVVALRNGNVVVFDQKGVDGPTLMLFDSTGRFMRNVGRKGAGPGEYTETAIPSVAPDGSFFLWDPHNARIDHYSADGTVLRGIPIQSTLYSSDMVDIDQHGSIYLQVLTGPIAHGADWPIGFERHDADGAIRDTIRPPLFDDRNPPSEFGQVHNLWTILPTGQVASATDDRLAILIHGPGTRVVAIERAVDPVRYDPADRRERQARSDFAFASLRPYEHMDKPPPVPEAKSMIREIDKDLDGRIWVRRGAPSVRVPPHPALHAPPPDSPMTGKPVPTASFAEPEVYDVFRLDGTYLGELRFPLNVSVWAFSGNSAWAMTTDSDDLPVLVKYRFATSGDH